MDTLRAFEHVWEGLYGPGATCTTNWVGLTYAALGGSGIAAVAHGRCHGACVRAPGG